jgi:hypothetical protein
MISRSLCLLVALLAVSAGCGGVEDRAGVVGSPTQDNSDGVLDSIVVAFGRALIDVELDRSVRGYERILASAALDDLVCQSGAAFTIERAPAGTGIEFRVDTSQDYDTSDPPAFVVEEVVVDC